MNYSTEKNYWRQDINKLTYLQGFLTGIGLILVVSYLFYGNVVAGIILSPYLFFHMKEWERKCIKKNQKEFQGQFKEAMQSISVALNVGYSAENAVREAYGDFKLNYSKDARILKELQYMIHQIDMNIPLEQIFLEFAKRCGDEEVQMFATVFGLAKRSGGDMIEIIRNAVWQIGEKIDVKQEIETMMAAKKMEFRIMSLIPIGMIFYISMAFPDFLEIMYGNLLGVIVMSVCLIIYLFSYEWGKRIVEIEV